MEIVVKGRNVEVPDHFREHVMEKLSRSERYDAKIIRVDVELEHETNRRQAKNCQRVQITLASRGPAVRAEARADSFYAALDGAVVRLESQMRRAADRRHDRQHARTPITEVAAPPDVLLEESGDGHADHDPGWHPADAAGSVAPSAETAEGVVAEGDVAEGDVADGEDADREPGRIVRIKSHPSEPIGVDEALRRMELVGHDFYLFSDLETGVCSVVYRRKGFNYGLLRLDG